MEFWAVIPKDDLLGPITLFVTENGARNSLDVYNDPKDFEFIKVKIERA